MNDRKAVQQGNWLGEKERFLRKFDHAAGVRQKIGKVFNLGGLTVGSSITRI